ncbi:conserved Plasmodium protein, unknown function [Plasmodium ovale wallikeri]|uniref:Uncharacterized protein n=2 Tax=Plasmodium ovale TaxID=36330 RepID=A0A1A8YXE1_PLAOA|nr:conserved Plasmodium protein, unknown function [Plasmodium ovale wallikeri]SBT36120.1 conserved Plasmodium protein, unknown function [Plasmodium ovale wallikeri]SBT77260.1 conserved Plasmodium protein, unknown function [Plasmodium ovale]
MLIENRKVVRNGIYEYNDKLKLYIILKQSINNSGTGQKAKVLDECYNKYVKIQSSKFSKIKWYDDDCTSETHLNADVISSLLYNYSENNNGCAISFFNICDHVKTRKKKTEHDKNNTMSNCISNSEVGLNDLCVDNLVNNFYSKVKAISIKKSEKKKFSLRYGMFISSDLYDLLEDYEHKEHYKTIKSCTLKWEEKICSKRNNKNQKKGNTPLMKELKMFNEKIKEIQFLDSNKLKDILLFAEKKKKELVQNKLKNNTSFYSTCISIDISKDKEDGIFPSNNLGNTISNKYVVNNYCFINIYCVNSSDETEEYGSKEGLNNTFFEFNNIIKSYNDSNFKVDISNFSRISKIVSEICNDVSRLHLKTVLHISRNYNIENEKEHAFNFLYSIDFKLKDFFNFFFKSVYTSEGDDPSSEDSPKDLMLLRDEKYDKIDHILFKNIDLDEKTKCNIIKEAINFPEKYFDKLSLLNKTFEHNYILFKDKEIEICKSIISIVEKQNRIMKKYKQEEEKKKNDIHNILKEISYINEQNAEIEKEIQKHQMLNSKYLLSEQYNKEQNLKKFQTANIALDKEYESFLKFRNEPSMSTVATGKGENKQEKQKERDEQKQRKIPVGGHTRDSNTEGDVRDLCRKQDDEYLKNLNEAIKYAEHIFQETNSLKKRYDEVISKKVELINVLKNTALKFNEKANSLTHNFKGSKELKLIYPIDDNRVNFAEKYEQAKFVINNDIKEYKDILEEFEKRSFNDEQLKWIYKMNSLSKKF